MGLFKIELEDQVLHKETWTFMDMAYPSMVGQVLLQKTKDQYSIIRVNMNHSGTTWSFSVGGSPKLHPPDNSTTFFQLWHIGWLKIR